MKFDLTNPIYHDPDAARAHLEALLWPDGPLCPHCGSKKVTKLEGKAHRKGLYQCNNKRCRKQISVTVGTVFERSRIPLNKWVLAAHLMGDGKKSKSAKEIQCNVGVSYKSAWFMMHRLRAAMAPSPTTETDPLGGKGKVVESTKPTLAAKRATFIRASPFHQDDPSSPLSSVAGRCVPATSPT